MPVCEYVRFLTVAMYHFSYSNCYLVWKKLQHAHLYLHTVIGHKIMTSCLNLFWSIFCCQNIPDPLRHGLPEGVVCTKILATDPLSPVGCEVGSPSIGLVCPTCPTDDLGNLDAKSTSQTHCCSPQSHFWTIFALWQSSVSCWKRPQVLGNIVSMEKV